MDNIENLVENKISQDRDFASEVSNRLLGEIRDLSTLRIEEYFPEIGGRGIRNWSNWPQEISLPHQLLLGQPIIFDLEPLSEREFEQRYRISIRVAEELTEIGLLLPNLYTRDPSVWKEMEHLRGLLDKSFVNGERVNSYFRAKQENYDNFIATHKSALDEELAIVKRRYPESVSLLLQKSRAQEESAFGYVVGTRWAYLDVMAPQASTYVDKLLSSHKLEEVVEFVLLTKHLFVSPISASLGGEFTWGPKDLARLYQVGLQQPGIPARTSSLFKKPDHLEYLIHEVTGAQPYQLLKDMQAEHLVRILRDPDVTAYKEELSTTLEAMAQISRSGEVDESNLEDWKRLTSEISKAMKYYQRLGRVGSNATTTIVIGYLIDPQLGLGTGAVVNAIMGEYADKVGNIVHRFISPTKHRFILSLEQLKQRG